MPLDNDTLTAGYPDRQFDRWLDVDLPSEAQRMGRLMGALPPPAGWSQSGPFFEDVEAEIQEADWPDYIKSLDESNGWMSELITWICDQDGEGSCVSNATIKQHEVRQAVQYGKDKVVRLSPISLYEVCGGGPGTGSTLERNIQVMTTRGCLPLNTADNQARFKHTFKHNGYYDMRSYRQQNASTISDTFKLFRHCEYYPIRSYLGFGTALIKQMPVLYARNGHSILGIRLFWRNGSLVLGYTNSWSLQWGDVTNDELRGGMGYDSRNVMRNSYYGAYALRSVKLPTSVWLAA